VAGSARVSVAVDPGVLKRTALLLLKELAPGKAAALAAQLTGARRSEAYALALEAATEKVTDQA
jgi:hypothetical protein